MASLRYCSIAFMNPWSFLLLEPADYREDYSSFTWIIGCWFVVYIRRFIYKFLNVCPFDYTVVAGSGKVGPINQVNLTSWVAVVTPTDRPKSVRNRCVILLICIVVCVVTLPFWHFCWCRGFCHRTESDLFLFLSFFSLGPFTALYRLFLMWVSWCLTSESTIFQLYIWRHMDVQAD